MSGARLAGAALLAVAFLGPGPSAAPTPAVLSTPGPAAAATAAAAEAQAHDDLNAEDSDPTKRLQVIINHNNDMAEYWEYSDYGFYPIDLSNEAYKLGVNYMVYALTH